MPGASITPRSSQKHGNQVNNCSQLGRPRERVFHHRPSSGGVDGVVRLFDAASLRELVGLRGHVARVTALEFAPGDSSLVSGSRDGTLRLWAESRGR